MWLGLLKARRVGFSPHVQVLGEEVLRSRRPYSLAHIPHYLLCPKRTQVLLFLHKDNCPSDQILVTEVSEPQRRELHLHFLLPLSTLRFFCLLLFNESKNWRNKGLLW